MMKKTHFRIVITGVTSGNSPQQVIDNLCRLFKTDSSKFQSLANGGQITVSKNADQKKANAYSVSLKKVGCKVLVVPESKRSAITPEQNPVAKPLQKFKCPKCNYVWKTTEIRSESECPKCGIIYSKVGRLQPNIESKNAVINQVARDNIERHKGNKRNLMLVISGVFLVIITVFLLINKQEEPPAQKDQQPMETIPDVVSENKVTAKNEIIVLPGESKKIVISSIVPIIHIDDYEFNPLIKYKVYRNKWEKEGVEVEVDYVDYSSFTHSVWEALNKRDRWYALSYPNASLEKLGFTVIAGDIDPDFRKNLAKVHILFNPNGYLQYQELSEKEVLNHESVKIRGIDEVRRTDYRFYKIDVHLIVDVPDISNSPGYVSRGGIVEIGAKDLSLGEGHGMSISHWAHLNLKHINGKRGLIMTMDREAYWELSEE